MELEISFPYSQESLTKLILRKISRKKLVTNYFCRIHPVSVYHIKN
jgi:hypothetical protein